MKHLRQPVLVKRPHQDITRDAAKLMSDGRERTAGDVAVRLLCRTREATQALVTLANLGLVEREVLKAGNFSATVYRKAQT